jgi:hypothetical protein
MANNRIYYPIQQIAFRKPGTTVFREAHGVQSVSTTTTFNLEQAFQLAMLAIYENIEGVPDVEVTLTKVLDGYPPLFLLATASTALGGSLAGPTLAERAPAETIMQMGIWPETNNAVSASPNTYVEMSGLTVSSASFNFPSEDNFTEDLTLAGNVRVWDTYQSGACPQGWAITEATGSPNFASNDDAPVGSGGVNRRENMIFATTANQASDADYTRLPGDIFGVTAGGIKSGLVHVASITVSTDLAREDLFELGLRSPYAKTVTFPVEVTTDIEVTSVSGDQVTAIDDCAGAAICSTATNLADRIIRIATCEGTRIYLGEKNKLASVSYGGGDAGGGNVSVTYSYTTFNDFTVLHSNEDFSTSGASWWAVRSGYLGPAGTTQDSA